MKKILLIQPPQWYPIAPHLAVPLLTAQLKKAGFNTKALDLNIKFFNSILNKSAVLSAYEKSKDILKSSAEAFKDADYENIKLHGSYAEKKSALKYIIIKERLDNTLAEITAEEIDNAVEILRSNDSFFIPEKLAQAKRTVQNALKILSLPFAPNEIMLDNYFSNPLLNLDWENVKLQTNDRDINMFYDFFQEKAKEIALEDNDIIAVSMTDLSQLIPTFTLLTALKKYTKAKIILGGNYATQISEDIIKHEDIFKEYIDFLLTGDGELSIVNLCECLNKDGDISNVSNLSYFDYHGNKVISNESKCKHIDLNELAFADFTDYDLKEYLTPNPTFPIQLSKGCYWGKCKFCDYAYGQLGYCPKKIERIIEEIKYYIDNYSASNFMFVDEAIPPIFYNKLALAIIDAKLKINYYSFARLEDGYTKEVLQNLYKSGARMFLWGYECESLRVMDLMNKGINSENRLSILKASHEAGIWNNGLFIFGYPTETSKEINRTMQIILNNRDIINSCTLSNFTLKKHSILKETVGENGIIDFAENGEFYTAYKDVIDGFSQAERRKIRRDFQFDFIERNKNALWSVVYSDFDHLLNYLSKYGSDYVINYRSKERICPEFR